MKALAVNTYAGSLLLGLKDAGAEVIGSYEDAGFGLPIQRANFPDLDFRATLKEWPDQDLRRVIVLAHPPCSAFSVQNTSARTRGVDSDAFACTKRVLEYGMENKAAAIAVESVTGAMAGAWDVHTRFARRYGYEVHRVLQNSILFGVPQWRERFWAVFVRKGLLPKRGFTWRLAPKTVSVGDVLDPITVDPGEPFAYCESELQELKDRFRKKAKCTPADMRKLFGVRETLQYEGGVEHYLRDLKFPKTEIGVVCRKYVSSYSSAQLTYLNSKSYAPVLMGTSWWWYQGGNMGRKDYNRIMGFPADYVFPGKYDEQRRTYLSKGVVPAVARWVYENLLMNLASAKPGHLKDGHLVGDGRHVLERTTRDGQIARFRGRRKDWEQFLETGRPPLREEREGIDDEAW